jgi:hypothetical protein
LQIMIIQWSSIEEKGNITVIVSSHNKEVLIYKFNQIAYFSELLIFLNRWSLYDHDLQSPKFLLKINLKVNKEGKKSDTVL